MVYLPKLMGKREGYLIVDHSASPGLPEDVAIASGYDPSQVGSGQVFEAQTLTCAHCRVTVVKNPQRIRERNYCPRCSGRYICDYCAERVRNPDYIHVQFEKARDAVFESAEKNNGMVLGSARELLLKSGLDK